MGLGFSSCNDYELGQEHRRPGPNQSWTPVRVINYKGLLFNYILSKQFCLNGVDGNKVTAFLIIKKKRVTYRSCTWPCPLLSIKPVMISVSSCTQIVRWSNTTMVNGVTMRRKKNTNKTIGCIKMFLKLTLSLHIHPVLFVTEIKSFPLHHWTGWRTWKFLIAGEKEEPWPSSELWFVAFDF